jgi:hypothetical protein
LCFNYFICSSIKFNTTIEIELLGGKFKSNTTGLPNTFTNIPYKKNIYYPITYKKLKKIKSKYDLDNVLTITNTL